MKKIKKAKFKGNIEGLKKAKCILMGISMKQTHQSGEELHAFINEIGKYTNIKKIIFVITDYLHRHYVQLEYGFTPEKSGEESEKMGEVWMQDNKFILKNLTSVELEIVKWKSLIENSNLSNEDIPFVNCLKTVQKYYNKDAYFHQLVDVYSKKFGNKYYNRLKDKVTLELCTQTARDYFLEESAIILKFISLKFDIMTYPGECNQGISYVYDQCFGKPLNFISYRFRKNGKENKFFPTIEQEQEQEQKEVNINEIHQFKKSI